MFLTLSDVDEPSLSSAPPCFDQGPLPPVSPRRLLPRTSEWLFLPSSSLWYCDDRLSLPAPRPGAAPKTGALSPKASRALPTAFKSLSSSSRSFFSRVLRVPPDASALRKSSIWRCMRVGLRRASFSFRLAVCSALPLGVDGQRRPVFWYSEQDASKSWRVLKGNCAQQP